jgi:hypothetical protein
MHPTSQAAERFSALFGGDRPAPRKTFTDLFPQADQPPAPAPQNQTGRKAPRLFRANRPR